MITEKRRKELIEEAKKEFLFAYESGQLNENLLDETILLECGYTKEEIKIYIKTLKELLYN